MVARTVLKLPIQKEASKSVENGESDSLLSRRTNQLITLADTDPLASYTYPTNFTSVWSTIESNQ